jgi:hypothetical protein
MLVKFFQLKFSILGFPLFKVGLPVFLLTKNDDGRTGQPYEE